MGVDLLYYMQYNIIKKGERNPTEKIKKRRRYYEIKYYRE